MRESANNVAEHLLFLPRSCSGRRLYSGNRFGHLEWLPSCDRAPAISVSKRVLLGLSREDEDGALTLLERFELIGWRILICYERAIKKRQRSR